MARAIKYISVNELVKITGKNKTTVTRWCNQGKVEYRTVEGNGGTRYEILVSSLDEKLQKRISSNSVAGSGNTHSIYQPAAGFSFLTGGAVGQSTLQAPSKPLALNMSKESCPVMLSSEQEETLSFFRLNEMLERTSVIPNEEKKKALAKVDLIEKWEEYRKNYQGNKTIADINFIELYNSGQISTKIFSKIGSVGISTLRRYAKLYKKSNCDYEVLVPNYNYGCESRLQSSLSSMEKYLLLKYMLHQNCYALGRAYELIRAELNRMGAKQHSYAAYRHVWEYLVRNYYSYVTYAREGLKSARDNALPYIIRKKNVLEFGEEIIGDGHTLDFMVQNPFNGKPCRATLIGFLDGASGDLVGYDIMLTENTQAIASALRNAIIYMGKYPKVVHLDNGKAFKSKYFASEESLASAQMQGIYKKMGIETLFSKAYNGRAKIIERFFKEFTESEAKTWSTYIGNCIDNKPAHTRRNEKFHEKIAGDYLPTIQEVKAGIDTWLNEVYRKRLCKVDNGLTIEEYVSSERGEGVDIEDLNDLMMSDEIRKIQRNGVKMFDTYYWNEKLCGLNTRCIVKYSFFDISYVNIYSLRGQFICKAERMQECHGLAKYSNNPKDYEEYKYQSRLMAQVEKNITKPMQKMMKQLFLPTVQRSYKPIEQKEIETKENLVSETDYEYKFIEDVEMKKDNFEYEIDYSQYEHLLEKNG